MDVKDNHLIDQERVKHSQEQDPVVSYVIDLARTKKKPTRQQRKREPREVIQLLNHWSRLDLNAKDYWFVKVNPIHKLFCLDLYGV